MDGSQRLILCQKTLERDYSLSLQTLESEKKQRETLEALLEEQSMEHQLLKEELRHLKNKITEYELPSNHHKKEEEIKEAEVRIAKHKPAQELEVEFQEASFTCADQ
jgi:hypothetical protein